jgi:hypothetical protein
MKESVVTLKEELLVSFPPQVAQCPGTDNHKDLFTSELEQLHENPQLLLGDTVDCLTMETTANKSSSSPQIVPSHLQDPFSEEEEEQVEIIQLAAGTKRQASPLLGGTSLAVLHANSIKTCANKQRSRASISRCMH